MAIGRRTESPNGHGSSRSSFAAPPAACNEWQGFMTKVRFLKDWRQWRRNAVASVSAQVADLLVKAGTAELVSAPKKGGVKRGTS